MATPLTRQQLQKDIPRTRVQILNKDREVVAEVKSFYPINEKGDILRYSKELSDSGEATFRLATTDPLLTQAGDVTEPHQYQVRILRGKSTVWQGGIIDNTDRNKNYVEVRAAEYLWYLDKVPIRRDAEQNPGDGLNNFRLFDTGTMKAAITDVVDKARVDFGTDHILGSMTTGTVENPDYPAGFTKANNKPLTGPWSFTDEIALQFDYHSALYVLKAFGIYANYDFQLTNDLVFNFKKLIGEKKLDFSFQYGTRGNMVDYNLPRLGSRMANSLTGIAATIEGTILHTNQLDVASKKRHGLLWDVAAFSDVKDKNSLKARIREQIRFTKTPEVAPINVILDEKAYPLGLYDIGDIVYTKIKDHVIDFKGWRRIVGITVNLHDTGREITVVQTNQPRDEQLE